METIYDIKGEPLALGDGKLQELTTQNNHCYYIYLRDLKKTGLFSRPDSVKIMYNRWKYDPMTVHVSYDYRVIGCRTFDKKTFKKILKAVDQTPSLDWELGLAGTTLYNAYVYLRGRHSEPPDEAFDILQRAMEVVTDHREGLKRAKTS